MPDSWLEKQPHLLKEGEVDPHEFIGRDDRPLEGRFDPEPARLLDRVNYVDSAVMQAGTAAVQACVRSGKLLSNTCIDPYILTNKITSGQIPVWAALSDAFHNLHRALGHISPQRLVELLKARDLGKDLNLSKSDVALVKQHVCDVCVRSKSSRSSHSGHLIHDDRICSTFAYDLQGPFNTPSVIKENV